jgi:hypothetical protein
VLEVLEMLWLSCQYDELIIKKDADSVVAGIKTTIDVNFLDGGLGGELSLIHSQFQEKISPVRLVVWCVFFMHAKGQRFKPRYRVKRICNAGLCTTAKNDSSFI